MSAEIKSVGTWDKNADLIMDVHTLGWLPEPYTVLDATYGLGRFWTRYMPPRLIAMDLNPTKGDDLVASFTELPFADRSVDVVVFDPPYKLSGTPQLDSFDSAYGVDVAESVGDRMSLILRGARECARVARKHLLVKCQDQVVSGEMRWQTFEITEAVKPMRLADRFDYPTRGIPQPPGRRQLHARHEHSQLLIFTRLRRSAR